MSSAAERLAALAGTYQHLDGCRHRVFTHKATLYQARTTPGKPEAPHYEIQPQAVKRMLDYKLLTLLP